MPHHITLRPPTYLDPSPADRPAPDDNQKQHFLIARKMVIERNLMPVCVCVVVPCCCAPAVTFATCCFVYGKATVGSAGPAVSLC